MIYNKRVQKPPSRDSQEITPEEVWLLLKAATVEASFNILLLVRPSLLSEVKIVLLPHSRRRYSQHKQNLYKDLQYLHEYQTV